MPARQLGTQASEDGVGSMKPGLHSAQQSINASGECGVRSHARTRMFFERSDAVMPASHGTHTPGAPHCPSIKSPASKRIHLPPVPPLEGLAHSSRASACASEYSTLVCVCTIGNAHTIPRRSLRTVSRSASVGPRRARTSFNESARLHRIAPTCVMGVSAISIRVSVRAQHSVLGAPPPLASRR